MTKKKSTKKKSTKKTVKKAAIKVQKLENLTEMTTEGIGEGTQLAFAGGRDIEVSGIAGCQLPLSDPLSVYSAGFRHVNYQLTVPQSQLIQRARKVLYENHVKTKNGRVVYTFADVIRYIFEQLEDNILLPVEYPESTA